MMFRWFAPFLAIVVLVVPAGCVGPTKVEAPQIALQDVKILEAKGLTQRLRVDLLVSNPNDFNIPLTGLRFDMAMNGLDFAEGLSNQRVDIPRLGRTVVPVEVTVSVVALVKQIKAVRRQKGADYRVAGTAFLDHALLPKVDFAREGKIRLDLGTDAGFKVM